MTEKELAELDAEKIIIAQVEELENEKRQLVARLKAQEKKVDHLERAKRKEEIPLIKESMIQVSIWFLSKFIRTLLEEHTGSLLDDFFGNKMDPLVIKLM